ncbi:CopG family transcriptional regulator [Pseudonocardia sp.]|uniref:ribbon-helix-helix domain-containing protein n=1 Tax=Pseudonocardia sp. TaxID=60912 RepID=UPI0026089972|nr:CopG family transcriptional regulator [Pseudonocardia sp.]
MAVLTQRLQLLLDEDRLARITQEAERRGSSVAALVREAIDACYPPDGPSRSAAGQLLLDAEPLDLGDWADAKSEIESMYPGDA